MQLPTGQQIGAGGNAGSTCDKAHSWALRNPMTSADARERWSDSSARHLIVTWCRLAGTDDAVFAALSTNFVTYLVIQNAMLIVVGKIR